MTTIKRVLIIILCLIILVIPIAYMAFLAHQRNQNQPTDENSIRVPILMYHHFADYYYENPGTMVSGERFREQLIALQEAGYTTISFYQLRDFVNYGTPLPEKPIIISIDDGYLSVYEVAFPILKELEMIATTFIIGVTHGMDTYKDTGHPIIPRFNDEQVITMAETGFKFFDSHSYDMHQHQPFEPEETFRRGVLRRENESEEEYIAAFREDFQNSANQLYEILGTRSFVFSYPFGLSNELTDNLLREMGVDITLKITQGVNIVTIGEPDTLFSMHRFNVPGDMTPEELLEMIR